MRSPPRDAPSFRPPIERLFPAVLGGPGIRPRRQPRTRGPRPPGCRPAYPPGKASADIPQSFPAQHRGNHGILFPCQADQGDGRIAPADPFGNNPVPVAAQAEHEQTDVGPIHAAQAANEDSPDPGNDAGKRRDARFGAHDPAGSRVPHRLSFRPSGHAPRPAPGFEAATPLPFRAPRPGWSSTGS